LIIERVKKVTLPKQKAQETTLPLAIVEKNSLIGEDETIFSSITNSGTKREKPAPSSLL